MLNEKSLKSQKPTFVIILFQVRAMEVKKDVKFVGKISQGNILCMCTCEYIRVKSHMRALSAINALIRSPAFVHTWLFI